LLLQQDADIVVDLYSGLASFRFTGNDIAWVAVVGQPSTKAWRMLQNRLVRYVDAVARYGSIRKAAEVLNIAPTAVNRQILDAERSLGLALFERLPRGMKLTSAGEIVLASVRRIDANVDLMMAQLRDIQGMVAGRVRLVASPGLMSAFIPRIVTKFSATRPNLDLAIDVLTLEEIVQAVSEGAADLGLGFDMPRDPRMTTLASANQKLGFVVSSDHPFADKTTCRLSDVVGERMILPPQGSSFRNVLDVAFAESRIEPRVIVTSSSVELRKQMVHDGAGITILTPIDVLGDTDNGSLRYVPIADRALPRQTLKLVARSKGTLEPLQAKLAEEFSRAISTAV